MKKILLILFIALAFTACREIELYHDLSEEEANDMLVVLQQEGVGVSKAKEVKQNETFWIVKVDSKRLADARRLLVEHNLPRKKELGLSGVYKEKGLIPTPDEQKARYLLALKGEIINSLLKIPEVIDADVVINIPTPDEFVQPGAKEKRPTAAVLIKARPADSAMSSLSEAKLQQFVANSVENLNPRDVSVIITYISQPHQGLMPNQTLILPAKSDSMPRPITRIAGVEVTNASQGRLKLYLAIFFVLLAVMAAGLVVTVIRASRIRQELDEYKGSDAAGALVEGKVVPERPRLKRGG